MYPSGVIIGSSGYACGSKQYVGYGDDEAYYATLYEQTDVSSYYSNIGDIEVNYGSGSGGDQEYEHNPYSWKATMAMHDMTDGWDLPPNCEQEGETFFGIPLSRKSESTLQSTNTFQNQFDFDYVIDRNYTYVSSFGTNHGWLVGEEIGNAIGSIVDKDTAHIPIFYTGTTNADMVSLESLYRRCLKIV